MGKIKRYKNRIEIFLSGDRGQRFFNFAYSIGAAIVIWGALFKILHLPGGNLLLAIGMGTEVLMFTLTAFDRPPRQYNWEEVFPVLDSHNSDDRVNISSSGEGSRIEGNLGGNISINVSGNPGSASFKEGEIPAGNGSGAGIIAIGGITGGIPSGTVVSNGGNLPDLAPMSEISETYVSEMDQVIKELTHLRETTMALNTLYELQLKSISAQLGTIENSGKDISSMKEMMERSARQSERYCEETEKMAQNMATLNSIYAGMIAAMSAQQPRTSNS